LKIEKPNSSSKCLEKSCKRSKHLIQAVKGGWRREGGAIEAKKDKVRRYKDLALPAFNLDRHDKAVLKPLIAERRNL
jgi:hypothetical protein